jgi:hypothetical protein
VGLKGFLRVLKRILIEVFEVLVVRENINRLARKVFVL